MTIAIGTVFADGVIVGADTKVVFSDGATSTDNKVFMSVSPERAMLAIAEASEDARASKMLAGDISGAFVDAHRHKKNPVSYVKEVMGAWHRSYGDTHIPATEFLVGRVILHESASLYFCQPPSTVICDAPFAIGRGARPVEPLLSLLSNKKCPLRPALLTMAYLLYIAKKDESSACGGCSSVLIITKDGGWTFVEDSEMLEAEELAGSLYGCTNSLIKESTGMPPMWTSEKTFDDEHRELLGRINAFEFSSLTNLTSHKLFTKRKRPGRSSSY